MNGSLPASRPDHVPADVARGPWRRALRGRLGALRASLAPPSFDEVVTVPRRVGVLGLAGVGGSGKVAAETAAGLARRGHALTWLSGPSPAFVGAALPQLVLDVPREPMAAADDWVDAMTVQLVRHLSAGPLDVLFVHYVTGHLEAAVAAGARLTDAGLPAPRIVAVVHGSDVTRFAGDPQQRRRMRQALTACDEVVAVSDWLARRTRAALDLSMPVSVIDNAVDVVRFSPDRASASVRDALAPADAMLLVHVSNMRPVKRAPDTVATLAAVRCAGIDARLVVVGDGPDRGAVAARAAALGVDAHVQMPGNVEPDALPELVAVSDFMLVTSSSESFSLVAMEALASGVPVVGTRCGGLERVLDGLTSHGGVPAVAVGDADALASGVLGLWGAPTRYGDLAAAGMRLAIEAFPRARQLRAYAALVEDGGERP